MSAEELFDDDAPAVELGLEERSSETRDAAVVRDVRFAGADGRPVSAYLIGPAAGSPSAGALFLHWLGEEDSSREEFVDEAISLAGSGVVSMLVQQRFPWAGRPSGVEHDRVAIGFQVRNIRRALTLLAEAVGPAKLAIVGHDFGAMHGVLAASVEARIAAAVCMAPTSTWADWFVTYFHVVKASEAAAYASAMADLDPVIRLPDVTAPLLLQFAKGDFYVPGSVARALSQAAPDGTAVRTYDTVHRLDEAARAERDAWLLATLGISE
jgi:pimeloyl-ACP methyl ester carboxylesterase